MAGRHAVLVAVASVTLSVTLSGVVFGCSRGSREDDDRNAGPAPVAPVASIRPEIPDVSALDRDGNRVDDAFDAEHRSRVDEVVVVEAVFASPVSAADLRAFELAGGAIRHVFRAVGHGFTGRLPRSALGRAALALGSKLLLLKADRTVGLHLDEATRTGRVRPIWAGGFAGTPGFSGGPGINIGIMDTGVDATHPDLAGRMVGWKDYTNEGMTSPVDFYGHGTHVAGIALGSGAVFGVGPNTLHYTDHGDLSSLASGNWSPSPIHLPPTFDLTSTATWTGGGTATLSLRRLSDGATGTYTTVSSTTSGTSTLFLTDTGTAIAGSRYSLALTQTTLKEIGSYAISNSVTHYPAVGDGFPALRGVAAASGWFGAKIFPASGTATTSDIGEAMDDMVAIRGALNIKIVNMSFSIVDGGIDTTIRAKANTMVANGILVVASGGNDGAKGTTGDPGRAANVITVAATNDKNQLTDYSSGGSAAGGDSEDDKPDLLAPGGSLLRSRILSTDSNSSDARVAKFPDLRSDDYTNIAGTSMSAPFVSGAAALVIQALEHSGRAWSFDSSSSPFLVKMLLLASATETNDTREIGSPSPTLGRSKTPKDRLEGYGIVNPDAAVEAVSLAYGFDSLSASTAGNPMDRRAWGRRIAGTEGSTVKLSLEVEATADYDLYLYDGEPGAKGNPVILASSDHAGAGAAEALSWTFTKTGDAYLFVKRVSGSGTFTLTGQAFTCGNGSVEPGCGDAGACSGEACTSLDGGAASEDAGTISIDAGVMTIDAGAMPVDASATPVDPSDASVKTIPVDASAGAAPNGAPTRNDLPADAAPASAPLAPLAEDAGGCRTAPVGPTTKARSASGLLSAALTLLALFVRRSRRRQRTPGQRLVNA